jgi:acyl-coenzyme A thioesterase PaaI-like protein
MYFAISSMWVVCLCWTIILKTKATGMAKVSAADITALIYQGIPATHHQAFRVQSVALPHVTCILAYHADQVRSGNTLSGPTLMMLADAAMYALVLALDPSQIMSVTHDFHMHFLARPAPQDLTAVATLLRQGRRSVVMRVDLFSGDQLVAHATGSYARVAPAPTPA